MRLFICLFSLNVRQADLTPKGFINKYVDNLLREMEAGFTLCVGREIEGYVIHLFVCFSPLLFGSQRAKSRPETIYTVAK